MLRAINQIAMEGNPPWFLPREIVVNRRTAGTYLSADEVSEVLDQLATEGVTQALDIHWMFDEGGSHTTRIYTTRN